MATLKKIQAPGFYDRLGAQTKRLVEGLQAAAQAAGVPFTADSVGGMFGLYFLPQRPQGFADVMKADKMPSTRSFTACSTAAITLRRPLLRRASSLSHTRMK